jgi:hypothetical protein
VIAAAITVGYHLTTRPATYRDAVIEVLGQRDVTYTGLELREACLPDPGCVITAGRHTFATVVMRGGRASYGQITCYDRRGDCYLDLATLGVVRAPLRDLRGVRLLRRPLAQVAELIAARVRMAVRRAQP